MEYCALCGRELTPETRTWRTVRTGYDPHRSPPMGFQEVAFCPECAELQSRKKRQMRGASWVALALVTGLVLLALGLLFSRLWMTP